MFQQRQYTPNEQSAHPSTSLFFHPKKNLPRSRSGSNVRFPFVEKNAEDGAGVSRKPRERSYADGKLARLRLVENAGFQFVGRVPRREERVRI